MEKYKINEVIESWSIFMELCEEFPELYDIYVEKIENEMKVYKSEFSATEEEKKQAIEKIWGQIKSVDWE